MIHNTAIVHTLMKILFAVNLKQVSNQIWFSNGDVWRDVCRLRLFKFFKSCQYSTKNCIHKLDFFSCTIYHIQHSTININIDVKILILNYHFKARNGKSRFSELLK